MSTTFYFGQVSYIYDDYGNLIINHETGALRLWQVFDETQQLNKLVIERHLGNSEYVEITSFI